MLIKEFRVVLPMTVDEYKIAQLYSVAEASKNETGGGEGVEVVKNEPFSRDEPDTVQPEMPWNERHTSGQYTHKIYHLEKKVPRWVRILAPKHSLTMQEKAWNAYPYCRTVVTNDYMKDKFYIKIESMHVADRGTSENVHELPKELLGKREVILIDIANDPIKQGSHKEDPKTYVSKKRPERTPLTDEKWMDKAEPVMCCYKLVTVYFKWFGLQGKVEKYIQSTERRIFTQFHRQLFCWTDDWIDLSLDDVRAIEDKTKDDLDKQIKSKELRGTGEDHDEDQDKD